jgi:trehalose 6-phosphate synthase
MGAGGAAAYRDGVSTWNAARLAATLGRYFDGERVIVVSNREPCVHEVRADGTIATRHPISGLVTALDPVLRASGGTWIAHGSGTGDRAMTGLSDRLTVDGGDGAYTLRRVWLTRGEERGYYDGFSNSGMWPLCHVAFEPPMFRRSDWLHYKAVNRRFADAVVEEAGHARPLVLVQDYHLALVPSMLRRRLPNATIVAFWHIPWPNANRYARLPFGNAIVDGLLGSDIIGLQTPDHVRDFLDCAASSHDGIVDREEAAVSSRGRTTGVRAYPISVEWPSRWAAAAPPIEECRRAIRADLGIDPRSPLVLSVDRLDYTKGIEERFAAVRRLLSRGGEGRPVFVQIAAPSRTPLPRYRELRSRVEALAKQINARFGAPGYQPVILIDRHVEPQDVYRFYRAADVLHVNSLDDGMNLVSKEFVTARDDARGSLVLSRFAGAARELAGAILVNPFDVDGVADGLAEALALPAEDQEARMRLMRGHVAEYNVFRWAGRLLLDAAALPASTKLPPRRTRICPRTDVSSSLRRGVSYLSPAARAAALATDDGL